MSVDVTSTHAQVCPLISSFSSVDVVMHGNNDAQFRKITSRYLRISAI